MDREQINRLIAEAVGVEVSEIEEEHEFVLDLNATNTEMKTLQELLEEEFDLTLEEFSTAHPKTVQELYEVVEDASL